MIEYIKSRQILVLPTFILQDLYLEESCYKHSQPDVHVKIQSPQTIKLLAGQTATIHWSCLNVQTTPSSNALCVVANIWSPSLTLPLLQNCPLRSQDSVQWLILGYIPVIKSVVGAAAFSHPGTNKSLHRDQPPHSRKFGPSATNIHCKHRHKKAKYFYLGALWIIAFNFCYYRQLFARMQMLLTSKT